MTQEELAQIDTAIMEHGDEWWNNDEDCEEGEAPNRDWILPELLEILEQGGLDLKLVKKGE